MGEVQRQGFVSPVCEALQQRVTTKGPYNVGADDFLRDVWRLAAKIREGGWRPDRLIALWRGGAPVGAAVHEFLKAAGWPVRHSVVKSGPKRVSNCKFQVKFSGIV